MQDPPNHHGNSRRSGLIHMGQLWPVAQPSRQQACGGPQALQLALAMKVGDKRWENCHR
jgi:hypothetical protein